MSNLSFLLGSLASGILLGAVKAVKGNASTKVESGALWILSAIGDYFTNEPSDINDFMQGFEYASLATFVTEVSNEMQVARQLWVPANKPVEMG